MFFLLRECELQGRRRKEKDVFMGKESIAAERKEKNCGKEGLRVCVEGTEAAAKNHGESLSHDMQCL